MENYASHCVSADRSSRISTTVPSGRRGGAVLPRGGGEESRHGIPDQFEFTLGGRSFHTSLL